MRNFQKSGIALFLVAIAVLIILPFLERYKLTESSIKQAVGEPAKQREIKIILEPLLKKSHSTNFQFLNAIETQLEAYNKTIYGKYEIKDKDIEKWLSAQNPAEGYDNSLGFEKFSKSEEDSLKAKYFSDYTAWLNNQQLTPQELRQRITKTADDINKDVKNQIGYSESEINALQLSLTRHSSYGVVSDNNSLFFLLLIGMGCLGALFYIIPKIKKLPGIKNDHIFHSKNTGGGWIGYLIGSLLILFYIILYWFPEFMTSWMILVDPLSIALSGHPASQWFFYGMLYTLAIIVMGIRMFIKYRHSNYHKIRTASVMFFQLAFAFLIPELLMRLNYPSMDLKNIWPLNYTFFYEYNLNGFLQAGTVGLGMFAWGILLIVIGVPLMTYFYGKRWYCSWVCGCGGLAETLGDPYRQLSNKSLKAWKIERWMVHAVLVLSIIMTVGVLYTYFTGSTYFLFINTYDLRAWYGFFIGAAFAGVVGVGFYPFMGNRVWCRFGCPLAAYLGIVQRFRSRFRITTNGGQCISCGNCSTYCEMGIDVRWYAQRQQNIVRASCVGCGICASVCPRGVLKLENGDPKGRFND